jgi:hypothetical protein
MGLVLMAGLIAGCALGLIFAASVGGVGVLLAVKSAKRRRRVWWCFAAVFVVLLLLGIVAVHQYPFAAVSPGSDYDVALKNLFLQGLGYCATPGPAALLAALATLWMPKRL